MKVEILKTNFKTGLNIIEKIIGKNLSLPILDNVLITTEDSFLKLTSTDLETAIKWWILAKISKKGKIIVPARFLSNFISLLPEEKIILEEKNQALLIECKNYKTQIQGFNPDDFPIIPEVKDLDFIEVDSERFSIGLSQIVDVTSPSQARPEISGIYFRFLIDSIKTLSFLISVSHKCLTEFSSLILSSTISYNIETPKVRINPFSLVLNHLTVVLFFSI